MKLDKNNPPKWVTEITSEVKAGSVLFTKDGRITGNAVVSLVFHSLEGEYVVAVTDAGNAISFPLKNLTKQFYVPIWVCDYKESPAGKAIHARYEALRLKLEEEIEALETMRQGQGESL